ncbi:MAG: hypothetical protein SPL30_02000 [Succinivibrio sp.]|nr:hypothetical protein [Succinivibrio sp.]
MSGLFKPKDGDFASLIGKLDAESLEKFTAGSKKPLKEPRSSSPSQPGDFSKNAAANAGPPTAAAHKTSLAENIVIALIFTAVYWGVYFAFFRDCSRKTFIAICLVFISIFIFGWSSDDESRKQSASGQKAAEPAAPQSPRGKTGKEP